MHRRFNSFLLRRWERADGAIRIEVEHIQDGARVVVDSAAVALRWIDARTASERVGEGPTPDTDPPRHGSAATGEPPSRADGRATDER